MPESLQDIKQFCDEASALVRAGLPLEGVSAFSSRSAGKRLQATVEDVQKQTAAGKSVSEIIDSKPKGPGRLVTAAVAGGLSAGRLEASLEMLGDVAGEMAEIRHRLRSALVYPIMIMVIASGFTWLIARRLLYQLTSATDGGLGFLSPVLKTVMATLLHWHDLFPRWPLVIPAAVFAFVVIPFFLRRTGIVGLRGPEKLLLLIPGVRSVMTSLQFFYASRILSLLIDNNIPLTDALAISGTCSERIGLNSAFRKAATDLANGKLSDSKIQGMWKSGQLPPLIAVALKDSNGSEQQLKLTLSGVTAHYHRRLESSMQILRQYVPVGLTVVLGGTTVLVYALIVFWPAFSFYHNIVQEGSAVL